MKYIGKIPKLSMDKINIMALPGEGRYEGKVSYFFCDKEKTEELMNACFGNAGSGDKVQINPIKNKFIKVKVVDATSIGRAECVRGCFKNALGARL